MFKNHALHVTMVKKTPTNTTTNSPDTASVTPDEIAQIIMYHANHAAKIAASLYVGKVVLTTGRDIAVMYAASKFR